MEFEKIHNKGQARLFKSDFLEALTKANPLVIWGMYIPILGFIIYTAATKYDYSAKTILLVFFGGMFFWSFFEYIAHRFIFHWVPKSPRATKFVYTLHGNHHHYAARTKFNYFIFFIWIDVPRHGQLCFHVLSRIFTRLPDVWHHALCNTCLEPAF
jgi:hypothetical protein